MSDYEALCEAEFEKLQELEEKFRADYQIASYASWFYDQESELLRLYNSDDDERFFKYVPVGTYATEAGTWLWSWDNEHSIEKNKNATLKVKEFGEIHQFEKLTTGLIECEQEECWNFVALSRKLLDPMGLYCTQSRGLIIYMFIVEEFLDTNAAAIRKMKQRTVDCGVHG